MDIPARPASNLPQGLRTGSLLLIGLTAALVLFALWSRPHLPLGDLSNHAARHYLESLWLVGEDLPPFYEIHWRLVPNLGGDLVIPLLMRLLPPETAVTLAVTLAVLAFWLGAAWFLHEQGGGRPGAVLAALLVLPWLFNSQLFWGFFNYYSGLGLTFAALAHFTRLMRRDRPTVLGLLLHTLLVSLLFLWHLAVWGNYGVVMGCILLAHCWDRLREVGGWGVCLRRAVVLALPSVPSLVLFGLYVLANRDQPESGHVRWGTWERKLIVGLSMFRGYDWWADVALLLLSLAAVVACFAFGRGRQERGGGLLLAMAGLILAYVVLPFQLGSTSDTDSRLLPALLVCAIGWLGGWPIRRFRLALGLLALGIVLRYGSVILAWNQMRDRLDDASASFASLEPGSRVVPVVLVPEISKNWPEGHYVCWSVVHQRTFVPILFSAADQQPLVIREPYRSRSEEYLRLVGPEARLPAVQSLREDYDFVWVFNPFEKALPMPESFQRVYQSGAVSVWRIR